MRYFSIKLLFTIFILLFVSCEHSQDIKPTIPLEISFQGDAKIEIGGNLCGLEFHHSKPLPQRISFYYPLANSIDFSRDYWTRDTSYTTHAFLILDSDEKIDLTELKYTTFISPYSAKFISNASSLNVEIEYNFMKEYGAFAVKYSFKNLADKNQKISFNTELKNILRSSHSYSTFYPTNIRDLENGNGYILDYSQVDVGNSSVYSFDQSSKNINVERDGTKFLYTCEIKPNETVSIIQVVGSSSYESAITEVEYLKKNLTAELQKFTEFMQNVVTDGHHFMTGDSTLDHSIQWAKSMLEANRHYIDGSKILMPCPAEYNFFFTHDVLLCDLAIVNYNPGRVKEDLQFITKHGNEEKLIPHAYYWKDSAFATEFAGDDNWNHFWFVIASSAYLRHSGDKEFISEIYPYIKKSLSTVLGNKIIDGLVYSHRPDWWDAGDNTGPRSYMTILAYKALMEYIHIAVELDQVDETIVEKYHQAELIKKNLSEKLWNQDRKYLMNYLEDGSLDEHYYMGSILALHYGLLNQEQSAQMLTTIEEKLLDKNIGIYNVFPMDIHTITKKLDLKGGEEGKVGYYFNGGIWTHANAFYILGLINNGLLRNAEDYMKKFLTVKGNMLSPVGQPAMYEYRVSAGDDYGLIDKPNFSWAAGWYMYTLYNLYGVKESTWDITLKPYLSDYQNECDFNLFAYGNNIDVHLKGNGSYCEKILFDDKEYNSLVLPGTLKVDKIDVVLGRPSNPYLREISSKLEVCSWSSDQNLLSVNFEDPLNVGSEIKIVSDRKIKKVEFMGQILSDYDVTEIDESIYEIKINIATNKKHNAVEVYFHNN
ncbi:MAG: hypothetical protein KKA84_11430 [Bacteroidetes bacterium]|nr:hypothetical protein [Bacteroidota bacterium]